MKNLAAEIDKLEAAISAKVKATPEFAERAEIIESVPGLAQATSAILIAGIPELGQVSDEVAAALIGVAPTSGCARRLHAQADHHSQHDARTPPEMESRPFRHGVTRQAHLLRSVPDRAHGKPTDR